MKQQLLLFRVLVDIGVWHDGEKDVFNNAKGFTETVIKEIATYGYTSVYVCVCRCVTRWHMARPAWSEIIKSSVSNVCAYVCVR